VSENRDNANGEAVSEASEPESQKGTSGTFVSSVSTDYRVNNE
jgi:hypothetical protein